MIHIKDFEVIENNTKYYRFSEKQSTARHKIASTRIKVRTKQVGIKKINTDRLKHSPNLDAKSSRVPKFMGHFVRGSYLSVADAS